MIKAMLTAVLYFIAWVVTESLFSKSFAIAATVLLPAVFPATRSAYLGIAARYLYAETKGFRALKQLDAATEWFDEALEGDGALLPGIVASLRRPRICHNLPTGLWTCGKAKLKPQRFALSGDLPLSQIGIHPVLPIFRWGEC